MAKFGELVAELRNDRGLTQRELGAILHVSTATVSNYENGNHYPDVERLIAIANYFDVTVDYLLGRTSLNITLDELKEELVFGKNVLDVADLLKHLPTQRKNALWLIMSDMALASRMMEEYENRGTV